MAGVIVTSTADCLRAKGQTAVGIGLPGKAPNWQIARLHQRHLR